MVKKIQKKVKLSGAGRAKKKAYRRCEKSKGTCSKVRITSFELFYTTPRSDEDILADIRRNYLECEA